MRKIQLMITPELMAQLGLTDSVDDAAVVTAIKKTAEQAAKVPQLQSAIDVLKTESTTLKSEKETAENALNDFKAEACKKEVNDLLEAASTDKKISNELKSTLAGDYATNPEGLKKVLTSMSAYVSIADKLGNPEANIPESLKGKTYMELHAEDKLEEVKAKFPGLFAQLKQEYDDSKKQ